MTSPAFEAGEGPGHYDGWAEKVLRETEALAVVVMVVGGNRGDGFEVCEQPMAGGRFATTHLPGMLRSIADSIEEMR